MAPEASSGNPPRPVSAPIAKVERTSDTLTGRGGLTLFSRYLRGIGIYRHLERLFGPLKKSAKGVEVSALFHQLFCFLVDGTSRHLVHFDALKEDEGYARGIETAPGEMASSHAVKRFFYAFGHRRPKVGGRGRIWVFRYLLLRLFVWHLRQVEPEVVRLGLDPMVMDNDQAPLREGVQPTYKKVKGFQPLQLTWGPFVIDALFRGGKKHGNAGDVAGKVVKRAVKDFRDEKLPFQSFQANAAFYYTALVAFFLYEAFKREVTEPVLPPAAYATRFRRQVIDVAAKIVRTGGETFLKVTEAVWDRLRIPELWDRTADPPRFAWV